jgi:hypothetical protein
MRASVAVVLTCLLAIASAGSFTFFHFSYDLAFSSASAFFLSAINPRVNIGMSVGSNEIVSNGVVQPSFRVNSPSQYVCSLGLSLSTFSTWSKLLRLFSTDFPNLLCVARDVHLAQLWRRSGILRLVQQSESRHVDVLVGPVY